RRWVRLTAGGVVVMVALSGCATLQENRPACLALSALAGAVPGGVGGAVGVKNINRDNNPDVPNGHIAAGAAAGAVAGGLIGLLVGNFGCPEEGVAPPPPAPPPPPPPSPPTRRGGCRVGGKRLKGSPETTRVHPEWSPAASKAGRASGRTPGHLWSSRSGLSSPPLGGPRAQEPRARR